jgi:hypothetical protein
MNESLGSIELRHVPLVYMRERLLEHGGPFTLVRAVVLKKNNVR